MPKRKKQLGWWVPEEEAEAFKRAVLTKWGKLRGVLGDELARAMSNYMDNHISHAHTHTPAQIAPHSLTFKRCFAVFQRIKSVKGTQEFSKKEFALMIRYTLNVKDGRVIQDYQDHLCDLGWIALNYKTLKYCIFREPGGLIEEEGGAV